MSKHCRTPSEEFVVLDDVRLLHLPSMHVFLWPYNQNEILPFGSIAIPMVCEESSGIVKSMMVRKTCPHQKVLCDLEAMYGVKEKSDLPWALLKHGNKEVDRLERYIMRRIQSQIAFSCTQENCRVLPDGKIEYIIRIDYDSYHEDHLLKIIPQHSIVTDPS